jgi:S-adenosylmethionine/arginine decarboxylase-like enzyme
MAIDFNHKHILLLAENLSNPLNNIEDISAWLLELVKKVDMKVLMGPYVTYCDTEGNEGITGIVVIETSHCSVHIWSSVEKPFLQADLYSCKDFDPQLVINHFAIFEPEKVKYLVVDRNVNKNDKIFHENAMVFYFERSRK